MGVVIGEAGTDVCSFPTYYITRVAVVSENYCYCSSPQLSGLDQSLGQAGSRGANIPTRPIPMYLPQTSAFGGVTAELGAFVLQKEAARVLITISLHYRQQQSGSR